MQLFNRRLKIHAKDLLCRRKAKLIGKGRPVIGHSYRKAGAGRKLCQCQ